MKHSRNAVFVATWGLLGLLAGCGLTVPDASGPSLRTARETVTLKALYGGVRAPSPAPSSVPPALEAEARRLIAEQRCDAAIEMSEAASLGYLRGVCFALTGRDDRARQELDAYDGDDLLAYYARALLAHRAGMLDQASRLFYRASLCPRRDDLDRRYRDLSLMSLAMVLGSQGRLQASADAWRLFDDAQRDLPVTAELVSPDGEHYRHWGEALFELGRYGEAAEVLDRAFRFNKADAEIPPMLVESLMRSDQLDAANDVALEMLAGPTDKGVCTDLLVRLLQRCDGGERTTAMLDKLTGDGVPETPVLLALARTAWLLDCRPTAIAMLDRYIEAIEYPHVAAETLFRWLLIEGRIDEAMELCVRLLKLNSDCYDQISRLFDAARRDVFTPSIIATLLDRGGDDSDSLDTAVRLYVAGLASLRADARDAGRDYLSRSAETGAMYAPAVSALAELEAAAGRTDLFTNYAERFAEAGQNGLALYLQGRRDWILGEKQRAVLTLERSLQLRPAHDRARIALAELQFSLGRIDRTIQILGDCIARYGQLRYAVTLASFYQSAARQLRESEPRQSEEALRRAQATLDAVLAYDAGFPAALTAVILRYNEQGNIIEAGRAAEQLYDLGCRDENFLYVKVLVQTRINNGAPFLPAGRYARAMADLDEAEAVAGPVPRLLALRAELNSLHGLHAQAAEHFIALRQRLDRPDAFASQAAREFLRAGDRGAALANLELLRGEMKAPDEKYLYYDLRLDREVDADGALLDELLPAGRAADAFWRALALWRRDGSTAALRTLFDAAIVEADRDAAGAALIARLDVEAACALARQWFDGRDDGVWLKRIVEHRSVENPALAAELPNLPAGRRIARLRPMSCCTPVDLAGWKLIVAGRFDAAEALYDRVVAERRPRGRDGLELAEALRCELLSSLEFAGHRDRAATLVRRYLDESPDSLPLLRQALSVLPPDAADYARYRRRALALAPLDAQLNNNMAYAWVNRSVYLDRAAEMLYRAMEFDGGAHVKDSLGWLMYKRGWLPRARIQLEQAVNEPAGDNAVVLDHLGDVYWRLGRTDQALFMWREAADLARGEMAIRAHLLDADSREAAARAQAKVEAAEAGQEPETALMAAER